MVNKRIIFVVIAFVQIFLILNSITIQANEIGKNYPEQRIKIKYRTERLFNLLLSFFSIKQIGFVNAASSFNLSYTTTNYAASEFSIANSNWNCCFETFEGAICQDVPRTLAQESCTSPLQTKCSNTAECAIGCCYDEEQGLCSTRSTKYSCESNGGIWKNEENCLVAECEKGCCILGPNVEFTTERRCQFLSMSKGYDVEFKDSLGELQCILLEEFAEEGACILAGKVCLFTSRQDCATKNGEFNSGKLCSNEIFNNGCKKQISVGCVEGKDEIYWFDSCGNRENIYSSNKETSWNNGLVLSKGESCGAGSSNINSVNCGNCDRGLGSICSVSKEKKIIDGENICKSLKCIDEKGKTRENGESWCVYDGIIGEGLDVVGSRHWKRICQEGEVIVEPCADYRGQICVQSEMKSEDKTITQAQCVVNDALSCLEYNSEEDKEKMKENCEENPQCILKNINVDDGFKFDLCVGQYPKGFDLSYTQGKESAKQLCAYASQECIVYYEKKISGWDCVFNCHCEEPKFVEQMHNLCISMGDCGGYVNTLGEGTNSFRVQENSHKISYEAYSKNCVAKEGQFAKGSSLEKSMGVLGGQMEGLDPNSYGTGYLKDTDMALKYLSMVSGGVGTLLKVGTSPFFVGKAATAAKMIMVNNIKTMQPGMPGTEGVFGSGGMNPTGGLANTMNVLANYGFTMMVGSIASMIAIKAFGLSGDAALVTTVAGVTAAIAVASVAWAMKGISGCLATGPAAAICAAIVVIVVIITALAMKALGIGETKEVHVKYDCLPWQAPFGSDDCSKCNDDPLKPCSKYRCESLGKACGIINENSENPTCIVKESDDGFAPEVELVKVSEGYKFEKLGENKYSIRSENGECIPEFTTVLFELKTSEYAQCKMDMAKTEDYESMSEYLLEGNMFEKNHTGGYMMPSLSSFDVYNVSGDIKEKIANSDIYVRCIDSYGRYNEEEFVLDFCLVDGPDKTPPVILKANPVNGAYILKDVEEIPFSVYLNEPADCKIDVINRDYDVMQTKMECAKNISDLTINGWECKTNLVGLSKQENKFYIRCEDQPWLEGKENPEENITRNVNDFGTEYVLYNSKSELKMEIISPKEINEFGHTPALIELIVETSQGFDLSGRAICKYGFKEDETKYQFQETGEQKHIQRFDAIESGKYSIYVSCKDDGNNLASDLIQTEIILDETPPRITRVYSEGEDIKFNTDEKAVCYYTENDCNFDIENATKIGEQFEEEHKINSVENIKYYIKCKDEWNNKNPYCATIVSKSQI